MLEFTIANLDEMTIKHEHRIRRYSEIQDVLHMDSDIGTPYAGLLAIIDQQIGAMRIAVQALQILEQRPQGLSEEEKNTIVDPFLRAEEQNHCAFSRLKKLIKNFQFRQQRRAAEQHAYQQ